ncbi:hypothetical protein N7540_010218 [Penicillium herquei]|nr:hypothetical protein N7540_010218 [Penicillium herquei]
MNRNLHRDLWNLHTLGCSIDQAHARRPHPDPLASIAYLCVYWVDHLIDCGGTYVETDLRDGGRVYDFLSKKYLHWLEALSLLGHVSEGLTAMLKLQGFLKGVNDSDLSERIQDGTRFLQNFKLAIEECPLQLYSSALLFCPDQSSTRASFQQEALSNVTLHPSIEYWNPCLQTLEGHRYSVNLLGVSPDGKRYLSASEDGIIKLWDSNNGKCTFSLEGHSDEISSIIWSEDGAFLMSASYDTTIRTWDLSTGKCKSIFEGHTAGINAILWFDNGTKVISASNDKTIRTWDWAKGVCTKTLEDHQKAVTFIIWLPSKGRLVSASDDNTIKVWDPASGHGLLTIAAHTQKIRSIISSQDDNLIISASDGFLVKVWDTNTWQCIMSLEAYTGGHKDLAISQDNKLLTMDSLANRVEIWDLSVGERLVDFGVGRYSIPSFVWFSDGRLATASVDGTIQIWNTISGQCISTMKGHGDRLAYLIACHDQTKLISASWDKSVKIWDAATPTENDIGEERAETLIGCPNGTLFAYQSRCRVKVWNSGTGRCISTFDSTNDSILAVSWWSTDSLAIVLTLEGVIKIWNPRTGHCSLKFNAFDVRDRTDWCVTSMGKCYHGSQYATVSDLKRSVRFWDLATSESLRCLRVPEIGANTILSYDGAYFASVADDQTIKVWDASTGQLFSTLEGHRSPDEGTSVSQWRVNSKGLVQDPYTGQWLPIMESWLVWRKVIVDTFLCWSNDSKWLVSASLKTIKVWEIATSQCALMLDIGRHAGKIRFSEADPYTLHTSIGSFDLRPYMTTPIPETGHLISSPQPKGYGFSEDRVWITLNGVNFLWLPPEYRPESTQQTDLYGETVVIGSVTGRVLFLKFPQGDSA